MKIEKNKSKKSANDLPLITQELIQSLLTCPEEDLVHQLKSITVWRYGKCELYHWIEVLNRFDSILAKVTQHDPTTQCIYMCPLLNESQTKDQILAILTFTALLIEHSYARHIYNSTEHLCVLLASEDLEIVLAVLNLFYVFGKRSNFILRLPVQQRNSLNSYLEYLGETWGGAQNGFGLACCCQNVTLDAFPETATSVYFEYQPVSSELEHYTAAANRAASSTKSLTLKDVDKIPEDISEIMAKVLLTHNIPPVQQMRLLTRLRLAKNFGTLDHRVKCVLVRLQAISVLVYSMAPAEVVDPLIYDGLVEELIEVLEVKNPLLQQEVKAAVLRTLTAIIHLERDPRLGVIIEATGAATYHGFLPSLVRDCVAAVTSAGPDGTSVDFPLSFATSLFSFLYHLATYEASGDALVNSGIMESLLQVLDWKVVQPMNITLVTRAVRVIDLITNLDMSAFHSLGGWDKMLNRLYQEVLECQKDVSFFLPSTVRSTVSAASGSAMPTAVPMDTDTQPTPSSSLEPSGLVGGVKTVQCMPERSALIKSILNFVKKAIPDPTFTENIRSLVDSNLPRSLAHIASNAEYYGPSIYLPATEVTTTFIFHDPSQLSSLQDNGLPWIILNSLINKKIPVTREVLSALPSILSAICLNARGLQIFIEAEPFDHLFGVLISSEYLPAMRRKRGNDPLGDTASNLGAAMDELMRHQPLLKSSVMSALIRLLKKLCEMGSTLSSDAPETDVPGPTPLKPPEEEGMTSDEDDDEEGSHVSEEKGLGEEEEEEVKTKRKRASAIPITEYTLNVVHFVDAILSNNSTDDHIKEFVTHGGLTPLLSLLSLPALPLNFPSSSACNSITSTCRSILNVAREGKLLEEGLNQLFVVLQNLQPFIDSPQQANGSVLLKDVNSYSSPEHSHLLHHLAAAGGYIHMFIHLSKCGQIESRQLCVQYWASPQGQAVLSQLSKLYRALVWEGFIVLAIASGREDGDKGVKDSTVVRTIEPTSSGESSDTKPVAESKPNNDTKQSKLFVQALKSFTPPLAVTSRVGRSLAELMSLLVRLCTGPLQRPPRRGPGMIPPYHFPLSEDAVSVCMKITDLLLESLTWEVPTPKDGDKIVDSDMKEWLFSGMTFKMYAVDFCLLLLFDEHKQAYHLMLHVFSQKSVLDAFIRSFQSALECVDEAHDKSRLFIADYAVTSDFLEAWLNLAEKLINASSILDSTHVLPVPPPSQTGGKKLMFNSLFNPLEFVIKVQKAIFPCVQKLWQSENLKWVMPEVVETLLTTIRHFYSSEKILETKLAEFKGEEVKTQSTLSSAADVHANSSPFLPRADPLHLQQLMDMGFNREHAEEALLATGNDITASMEWILTHPPSTANTQMLSEDEQLAQAIALSLGEPSGSLTASKEDPDKMEEEKQKVEEDNLQPLSRILLDQFSDELLDGALNVVSHIRDTVYRTCDLITGLSKRNGSQWREMAITKVKIKAVEAMNGLVKSIQEGSYEISGGSLDPEAFHVCLLALIMEEMPLACGSVVCTPDLLDIVITLLTCTQQKLPEMKREEYTRATPLWLSPLLLILELWQGIEGLVTWQRPTTKGYHAMWLWFENMNSRWCFYGSEINRTLESTYRDGEPVARISSSRQRYVVHFNNMVQINIDSGTQRPVLRLEVPTTKEGKSENAVDVDETDTPAFKKPPWFHSLTEEQANTIARSCTHLLSVNLDPDCLHANMRLLLSLTRNPLIAQTFMKERGPHALLTLTKQSSFQGFSSLSALLFRHILEDGALLEKEMESIIKLVLTGTSSDTQEIKAHGPGRRDFDFVLRRLAPCASRNKDLFIDTFSQIIRFTNLPPKLEDYASTSRIPPTVLKCTSTVKNDPISLTSIQQNLLNLLIDHLCASAFLEEGPPNKGSTHSTKMDEDSLDGPSIVLQFGLQASLQNPRVRRGSYRRQITDDDLRSEDMVLDVDQIVELNETSSRGRQSGHTNESTKKDSKQDETSKESEEKSKEQPMFSQAAILRLLAELIESYPSTSRMIIESTRKIKIDYQSHIQTTKEVSIIAFILDHLLPASYTQGNSATQVAKLAKVFLQCLATTTLPTDALNVFVTEFRAAFTRALSLPESQLKHHRIRALASLLGQIVEPQTSTSSRTSVNPSQFVRMLIRKGFITDLAKAIHFLDLSSPLLTTTINSLLKPLECLTKIVTQFVAAQKRARNITNTTSVNQASVTRQPSRPESTSIPDPGRQESTTEGVASDRLTTVNTSAADQSQTEAGLDAADISLIPLQEEGETEHQENEEEMVDDSIAITLAHELGLRCGQAAAVAAIDGRRDEEMDLEEIVDELLERGPGQNVDSDELIERVDMFRSTDHNDHSGHDLTDSEGSEGEMIEEDMGSDADNINSAGEEIEDEFESQNEGFSPRPNRMFPPHSQDADEEDQDEDASSSIESEESTDVVEEEDEPSDNNESTDLSEDGEEESMVLEEEDEEGGGGGGGDTQRDEIPGGPDETFEIDADDEEELEEEEEEDGEDEDCLELEYDDNPELYGGDLDFVHVEFPPWSFGWRDNDSLEAHIFGGVPSFLSRAYHIRPTMSEGSFPSGTLSSLPRHHPIMVRHANHPRHRATTSETPANVGRGETTPADIQRSNIVQQLLTNISTCVGTDEVLSFNVGGSNPRQTSAVRAPDSFDVSLPTNEGPDMPESTYIPNNLSRWREESAALDGHTAFLCIAALRPLLVKRLRAEYEKEQVNKKKDSKPPAATAEVTTGEQPMSAPNPSDEATPSTSTPRNGSQSVEQLQTSLRAVADALAQTVTEVRNARRLLGGVTSSNDQNSRQEQDPEGSSHSLTTSSQQDTTFQDPQSIPRSVASMPDLSTFDGSQDSARAILTRITPDDPLYTFLSAVARAPTPPLPESVSEPSNISSPSLPPSSLSPRLPVFTQMLPSDPSNPSSLPVPVIQDGRTLSQISSSPLTTDSPTLSQVTTNSIADSIASHVSSVLSQLEQTHSQSQQTHSQPLQTHSQSQSLDSVPSQISQSALAASNFADVLATELARAVSNHLPPSSSATTSNPAMFGIPPTTGSPSPSDTLAPMMSSLQMPPNSTQTEPPSDQSSDTGEPVVGQKMYGVTSWSTDTTAGEPSSSSVAALEENARTTEAQPMQTEPSQAGAVTGSTSSLTGQTSSATGGPLDSISSQTGSSSDLPEGIDPTFLAALPDSIRQEVLAQYERDQQRQQQQRQQPHPPVTEPSTSINPEVLAALPPEIQEEVLQQQRMEQARQQQLITDPTQPADAVNFLTSLTPDLRRTILSDMDDTLINHLPEEIASEARALRQERETRRRQYISQQQARYEHIAARMVPSWMHTLNPTAGGSGGHYRYAILSPGERLAGLLPPSFVHGPTQDVDTGSKQMLDQEGLACLVVLLFLDQTKLHFNRLFRIFRSLSQHLPSRSWLISSLLSIMKEGNFTPSHTCPLPPPLTPGRGDHPSVKSTTHHHKHTPQWLTININAALGSHAPVFQFSGYGKGLTPPTVYIHPHASISICNNILELLIFLARQFPASFLPSKLLPKDEKGVTGATSNQPDVVSNFWQILYKLDSSMNRKGKVSAKLFQYTSGDKEANESDVFAKSPIGQLMSLFTHPVIQGSVSLVDKLLRVLSVITGAIPKQGLSQTSSQLETTKEVVKQSNKKEEAPVIKDGAVAQPCFGKSVVSVSLLQSAVHLLTSGKCSEDTLDDATSLLINLSRCGVSTRETILHILLDGVRTIGRVLSSQITTLHNELIINISTVTRRQSSIPSSEEEEIASSVSLGTVEGVVLPQAQGTRSTVDHSNDLHLPCMEPLICKGSQQSFFLRLLKVVCQLRESVHSSIGTPGLRSTSTTPSGRPEDRGITPTTNRVAETQEDGASTDQGQSSSADVEVTMDSVPSTQPPSLTTEEKPLSLPSLSLQLELEELWSVLSECLDALASTFDPHAVLVLQSTVEAFFLVHADQNEATRTSIVGSRQSHIRSSSSRRLPSFHTISDTESVPGSPAPQEIFSPIPGTPIHGDNNGVDPYAHLPPDTARFLKFAERHRTVLNQILRQTTIPLSEGPFAVLVNHTRLLDFDVKRRYFRQELEQMEEGLRREDLIIHVRREHVFEDSYRELYRRSPEEMKANLYITFDGEEGQDAGGLLREWYLIIAREMFNPNYALFKTTPGDRVTYMPNPSSHINPEHLNYFKFVGRIIAKAIYDNKLLDCYFTRSFYKHILGKPVHFTDMESEDYAFYQGMVFLLEHDLNEMGMDLTFSTDIEEFGKTETRDLKSNGREIPVTEANKKEYVQLACQMKMTGSIRSQIKSFLDGFYDVIPKNLISIFNEQELELLISGLPNIDIDDLKANTEYHKYTATSLQIQWFWRALRSFNQADRARFLQFVTGTSKVPLQGFAALEGMNGIQKFQIHRDDRSTERLPSAHTCFNQLDLPPYETYDKLQQMLLISVQECPEGFGFA